MKKIKIIFLYFFLLGISNSMTAQFWKKLKKKATEKLNKAEDKLINKLDVKSDKIIDSTLSAKKANKRKNGNPKEQVDKRLKSYGSASISHSALYGTFSVNDLSKTKVQKEEKKVSIIGYWRTFGADVFDGYDLRIKNLEDINTLKGITFQIPEEATLKLSYNALVQGEYVYERGEIRAPQTLDITSGSATVTFNKEQDITIMFSANVKLRDHKIEKGMDHNTDAFINGTIKTKEPEYSIIKTNGIEDGSNTVSSIGNVDALTNRRNPTTSIPGSFSFDKRLSIEIIDHRGDSYPINILLGSYPDIYGMQLAMKEMKGQGNITIVNTPKSSTSFMDVAGMKMKKTTKLEELGDQYNANEKLPDGADFSYKKTGKTKNIAGYLCEEHKVDYNYVSNNGSASLWISKDFPIQNMQLPMLGMTLNNPYYSGFVMELSMNNNGRTNIIKVNNVSNVSVNINSNQFRKM